MKTATIPEVDFTAPALAADNFPAEAPANLPATQDEPTTILNIIARAASDPRVDIDKLDRLLAMQERVQARNAQVEFDNAMSEAQKGMKAIRANLKNDQTKSKYADYAQLDRAVRPVYSKHGFSLSFDTGEGAPENCVRIVCNVAHTGGHRERRHLDMPADGKGAKGGDVMTKTHATGAAITYGKRYLLGMIFNLAIGEDDDGNSAAWNQDIDHLSTGPRDENGNPLSTYNVEKIKKAKDFADKMVESLNLSPNKEAAKDLWAENGKVPAGKKKSPLDWLKDNSPGQFLRVQTAYENVVGLE